MTLIKNPSDFGSAIHDERKAQGLTQAQLASLCGVGITYLSKLENGKESAEIGKAMHIARMLGLDLSLTKRGE